MREDFSGIVGAPVTPFKEDNTVDYETFAKQLNFLIKNGVSLIAHPMHIGESINLTTEERKELARCLAETVGGRVPTFVHVSFGGTDQAADLARHSLKVGAAGVILMAPYHWRSSRDAIIDHYVTVAGNPAGKLIVYNNPKATNVDITPEILAQLFERLPNLVALKDASFNMEYFTEICRLNETTGRNIAIYTGIEYLLTSMPVGGRGCFSACAEVAPGLTLSLYRACAAMDLQKARPLQYKVKQLLDLLMQNYPATIKYAMELMGRPVGITRKPILPPTPEAKAHIRETLKALGVLDGEPKGW
jgi:dihydrodipicolinate synthase/N-acetylneuraminate lyase